MRIATFIYQKLLISKGYQKKIWGLVRKGLITLFNDPTCTLTVHGRALKFPLSHALPIYYSENRYYDRLPKRISEYVHRRDGFLSCIDVGANIGDSIASFYQNDKDLFLAIEPNPRFHKFLVSNWGWNSNITPLSVICGSTGGIGTFELRERNGTTMIRQANGGDSILRQSLDDLVKQNPVFMGTNVIKIDTDGHDFDVIAGAKKLIGTNRPIVLFECDVFRNINYVENCLGALGYFASSGYGHFLLYDNLGNYFGDYSLSDLQPFKNLLFYQLTGNQCYFDILIMQGDDLASFRQLEIDYFVSTILNKSLERTIRTVTTSHEPK